MSEHLDFAVELARTMAGLKVGDPAMETCNRMFQRMDWPAQYRCRVELWQCRAAQRGQTVAQVV